VEQMHLSHLTHFTFWARTYVNKWNIRKSLGFQQLIDAGLKKNISVSKKTEINKNKHEKITTILRRNNPQKS